MRETPSGSTRGSRWLKAVRIVTAVSTIVIGGLIVLVTAALGHCSAFGGRCPRPSTLDADIFGGTAMGMMLAVGGPLWMRRPTWRGLLRALAIAALVAIPVGLLVIAATQG